MGLLLDRRLSMREKQSDKKGVEAGMLAETKRLGDGVQIYEWLACWWREASCRLRKPPCTIQSCSKQGITPKCDARAMPCRSLIAAWQLVSQGYTNISILKGGFGEWVSNGRCVGMGSTRGDAWQTTTMVAMHLLCERLPCLGLAHGRLKSSAGTGPKHQGRQGPKPASHTCSSGVTHAGRCTSW